MPTNHFFIHGLGLLSMMTTSAGLMQSYTYHYNAIGSTIAMTDQGQNMVNKYAYSPFGGLANMLETVPQPFKFVGQFGIMSEPNGLYYMRARYYDQQTGRFISEDPIGFAGGDVNLYAYVQNNPVNLIDPEGKTPFIYSIMASPAAQWIMRKLAFSSSPGDGRFGQGVVAPFFKASDFVDNAINSSYSNYYAPAVDTASDASAAAVKTALDYLAPKPSATNNADFANGSFPAPAPTSSNGGGGNGC